MSTLFDIRVAFVIGPTVLARIEVCHPDQWSVPSSKNIALQVVVELYENMKSGFASRRQPISRQEMALLMAQHQQRESLERWLTLYQKRDGQAFATEADVAILEVHLEEEEGNPKLTDDAPDPKAMLVFTMRDATTLGHVASGFHFGSAMCDCKYW